MKTINNILQHEAILKFRYAIVAALYTAFTFMYLFNVDNFNSTASAMLSMLYQKITKS